MATASTSAWTATTPIPPFGPSADSYLRMDRIVQAAHQTGSTALHPGWGFLAESPRFARLTRQHGIAFCGPDAGLMELLGTKSPAKSAMAEMGLDVIPGSNGPLADVEEAAACANAIGYPVILKADSGGGGRGMRRCENEAEVREAYTAASAEALAAFGDGSIYLERFLSAGRHIEIQLLCDAFGNGVHLGERECSIQRKHQKLIEESPSPALTPEERADLGERAALAAVGLGYTSAGTIEFLRADSGELYFMEMNTRLQVEHPVSELVTGIDIARAQIEIAANRPLSFAQSDVSFQVHAIECRINAEDPTDGFRPTPGVLETFELEHDGGPGTVRVDTHLGSGDRVPPNYDSLLAKVIVHADTREQAIETMLGALRAARVEGVSTTIPMHLAVLDSERFRAGDYDTGSLPGWQEEA